MAKEILAVHESQLRNAIRVIRSGLDRCRGVVDKNVTDVLAERCFEEEEYLKRLENDELT